MTLGKTGERILAAVALSGGIGAFLLCLESRDGWDFTPGFALAAGTAPVFLNAFLFRERKGLRTHHGLAGIPAQRTDALGRDLNVEQRG